MAETIFDMKLPGSEETLYVNLEKSKRTRKIVFGIFAVLFILLIILSFVLFFNYQGVTLEVGPFRFRKASHTVRILQAFCGIFLVFVPLMLEAISKLRIPVFNILFYEIYLFMALGFGSTMEGFARYHGFDNVAHFVAGALGTVIGVSIWINTIDKPQTMKNGRPNMGPGYAFGLFMTGCLGVFWEIFEYVVDIIIPYRNAQRTMFPDGTPRMGKDALWDTMKDLVVNIIGAAFGIFLVWLFYRLCKGCYDRQLVILQDERKKNTFIDRFRR